jgi:hypothetical protein
MKPRSKEDWAVVLDAIEWFQQQLRAKSPDEVRAWIVPIATAATPQNKSSSDEVEALLDALVHAVRSHERAPDKWTKEEIASIRVDILQKLCAPTEPAKAAGMGELLETLQDARADFEKEYQWEKQRIGNGGSAIRMGQCRRYADAISIAAIRLSASSKDTA